MEHKISEIHPKIEMRGGPELATPLKNISLYERARLAVHTMNSLMDETPDTLPLTRFDEEEVRDTFAVIADPESPPKEVKQAIGRIAHYTKPAVQKLDLMLGELDEELINNAARIRTYVTNKLLEETEHVDGKIRLKALELLGKIKDVGLFSDKLEITHKTKTDEELEQEIQSRLEKFMGAVEIEGEVVREDQESPEPIQSPNPHPQIVDVDNLL